MLTTVKPWELKDREVIVFRGDHYTLTDDPKVGMLSVGWTTIHCKDRRGISIALMFEACEDVNVVRARDYSPRSSAQRKDAQWRSRRVPGSNR